MVNERTVEDIDKSINSDTQELYRLSTREITPMYPWVLLRVLDRDAVFKGLIHLPQHEQHKVVHEGIVIATWRDKRVESGKQYTDGYGNYTRLTIKRSEFMPGDHVLFPFWAGTPAFNLNPDRYRMVKECDWAFEKEGGIYGFVEHNEQDTDSRNKLMEILGNDAEGSVLAKKLEDEFVLVDRTKKSVTLSAL